MTKRCPTGHRFYYKKHRLVSLYILVPLYYAVGVSGKRKVNGKKTDIFSNEGGFSRHDAGL